MRNGVIVMPPYRQVGSIPRKRHIEHRVQPGYRGEGIYYEEVVTTAGFDRAYSIAYHLRPPTRVAKVEPAGSLALQKSDQPVLRHHHLKSGKLPARGDLVSGRVPLLFNDDVVIGRCRRCGGWRRGAAVVARCPTVTDHRTVEAPRNDEPQDSGNRKRRIEDFCSNRERAQPPRRSGEVFHRLPFLIAACRTSASRFTPSATDRDEIDAPETISMSLPAVMGSFAVLPRN